MNKILSFTSNMTYHCFYALGLSIISYWDAPLGVDVIIRS